MKKIDMKNRYFYDNFLGEHECSNGDINYLWNAIDIFNINYEIDVIIVRIKRI